MNRYTRLKQPELVRQALLDRAMEIVARDGFGALSIQAVALAAGVTKGGLFHHFSSKQALVEAMLGVLFERLDEAIDERLDPDPQAHGRFTRAYLEAVIAEQQLAIAPTCGRVSAAMLADPQLRRLRTDWLDRRLECHCVTDSDTRLAMVRLAADGIWFGGLRAGEEDGVVALLRRLIDPPAKINASIKKGIHK